MNALALQTYELTKRFGSFTALDHVSVTVRPGTVHALLGENGAGKSTLVKCIVGYQKPDGGSVLLDGREQAIDSPTIARALGIGMVYQHFTVVPGMTVAENLLIAKGGIKQATSMHVEFTRDRQVMKFTWRVNGAPRTRVPLTPFKGSDTMSPYIALAARS